MRIPTGNVLQGITVNPNKFQAVTTLNQIKAYGLMEPLQADKATQAQLKNDVELSLAHKLHVEVNRRFDRARVIRAINYSVYIDNIEHDKFAGGTPAITIYHGGQLSEIESGYVIPYNSFLTAIDGETQTQARFFLRDGCSKFGYELNAKPETGDSPFAITVYHGVDIPHAQQILHDYNTYATPVSEKKSATFNSTGPISIAVEKTIIDSGIDYAKVNRNSTRPTKNGTCSYDQIMTVFAGYVLNGNGLNGSITAKRLKELNSPGATSVPAAAIPFVSQIINSASSNDVIKKSYSLVWQVAGVLMRQGRNPSSLNWESASAAYDNTKSGGQGGARMSTKGRLAAIAAAF